MAGDETWIADQAAPNVAPAVHAAVFRTATRAMHRPFELMQFQQGNLSTDEIALLMRRIHEIALKCGSPTGQTPKPRDKVLFLAIALCTLFTWSEVTDAAEAYNFAPLSMNESTPLAIFLASDPAEDHFRIRALVPKYATASKSDPALFRNTAD